MNRLPGTIVRAAVIVVYALVPFSDVGAQDTAYTVRGVAYDSIAAAPLAGAVIQVVRAEAGAEATVQSAVTDAMGRYAVSGLSRGRYAIGLQHGRLAALGLELPIRAFEATADTVQMNLAIPSVTRVRALLCENAGPSDGVVSGSVVDAADATLLSRVTVSAQWFELTVVKGRLVSTPVERAVSTNDRGEFRLSALPNEGNVRLKVAQRGFHEIEGDIPLNPLELWHRELRLVRADSIRGTAVLGATVVREDSSALPSGFARIDALGVQTPITEGAFVFRELPAGTWLVDVKAIGYEPQQIVMEAGSAAPRMRIAMQREPQRLEAVNVVGKMGRDLKVLRDIHERSLAAGGTKFMPGHFAVEGAMLASDVIRYARGFKVKGTTRIEGRMMTEGFMPVPCVTRQNDLPTRITVTGAMQGKEVAIYVDGARWRGGLEQVNDVISPKELLAVEAYPDVISAPFLWRTNDACAVIAFWTRHSY